MTDVVVFHHALGLTDGVRAFARTLEDAGHTVHLPDLYDGRVFESLDEGVEFGAGTLGMEEIVARGRAAAADLPTEVAYVGFSLGVVPAQQLAQTRDGAVAAVLAHSCLPPDAFADAWPGGVPVQIHGMDADPYFAGEGDIDAARALVASTEDAELFVYPGDGHLFTDPSAPDHDPAAAKLFTERVLALLDRAGGAPGGADLAADPVP
ncbi:dienelactone hydrolase [Georgenia soli]|uniref:Dienelactone hydrolase n=1 Tax=Georgenia soli TaxID=638953 RepID=A0A2A9EGZ7_9MICO|nr:dienelactone hydrolase family protein [Georgenia soli]PFG38178.1 dienelactone hydrolase [Georgenia soli]